jgi:hypothetical protein
MAQASLAGGQRHGVLLVAFGRRAAPNFLPAANCRQNLGQDLASRCSCSSAATDVERLLNARSEVILVELRKNCRPARRFGVIPLPSHPLPNHGSVLKKHCLGNARISHNNAKYEIDNQTGSGRRAAASAERDDVRDCC